VAVAAVAGLVVEHPQREVLVEIQHLAHQLHTVVVVERRAKLAALVEEAELSRFLARALLDLFS
jgi:hypothetical protein